MNSNIEKSRRDIGIFRESRTDEKCKNRENPEKRLNDL